MEPLLEEHELDVYFTNILQIGNWKNLFNTDPLQLLRILILRQVTRVYFHNLQIASTPLDQRKVPSILEVITINLRGEGGNCLHVNYFMRILLKSIGYDVTTITGTIGNIPRNHVMNVVRLSPQESYLVDVGCGCPTSYPVPLHALPFTVPCCGGSTSEFRRINDQEYAKVQIGGGFFRAALGDGETEKVLITWDLTPADFESFQPGMTKVWKDEEDSVFCRNLYLFRQYFCHNGDRLRIIANGEEDKEGNEDAQLEFILIFGKYVLFGSDTRREVESFSSYEEMVPLVLKYFPKFDLSVLIKSFEYLNTLTPVDVRL